MTSSANPNPLMAPQNFRVTVETEELQRRIAELRNINTDLQVAFYFAICEFVSALLKLY